MIITIDGKRYADRHSEERTVSLTLEQVRSVFEGPALGRCVYCAGLTAGQLGKLFPDPGGERYMSSHGQLMVRIGKRINKEIRKSIEDGPIPMTLCELRRVILADGEDAQRAILRAIVLSR
jgi:hypothetical protein